MRYVVNSSPVFLALRKVLVAVLKKIEGAPVVGEEGIDPKTSFIEMGFDSLALIDLVDLINNELKVDVGVEVLLEHSCLEELATHLELHVTSRSTVS